MAFGKFGEFLNRVLYEEGATEASEVSQEEMATFEAAVAESTGENASAKAQQIITDSQLDSDNDEYPDISNVQAVLDTAGSNASNEMIQKILKNFAHCEPAELEKDGINRKQAIMDAIEQVKQQAAALKAEKAADEQALVDAERAAESACSEAIAKANADSERAIDEERARSAAAINEIRLRTDEAAEAAKQERDATRESIAAKRSENETALKNSANLVAEIERQGQIVIDQIDLWLGYLK